MAALTGNRNTPRKRLRDTFVGLVAASVHIYEGALVARNATGFLVPAADTAGLVIVGRSTEEVDNTAGADGAFSCKVETGVFKYENAAGGNAVVQADVLGSAQAEVADDQTVAGPTHTTNNVAAGRIVELESDGVWVGIGL
jgi:hypothetical protein